MSPSVRRSSSPRRSPQPKSSSTPIRKVSARRGWVGVSASRPYPGGYRRLFKARRRRVEYAEHGGVVGHILCSNGKSPVTAAMMTSLATWARRLSCRGTARIIRPCGEAVYRSVELSVERDLENCQLREAHSIGIDEIQWGTRPKPN
jgi:hypothetical protein